MKAEIMNCNKRAWPCWDLDEATQAEISRFLHKSAEEPETEASQNCKWLLSLMPLPDQPGKSNECEWESDNDEERFPESLPLLQVFPRNLNVVECEKAASTSELQIAKNDVSESEFIDLKKGDSLHTTFGKHISCTQQAINIKSLLRTFNDEKFSKEEKLKEWSNLANVENSVLISLIEEANLTVKCDEIKSDFCLLFSEIMKDKTFLLGRYFYLPWFRNSDKKASIPASTLSQTINLCYEAACEDILLPLLNSPQSCFLHDPHLLKDILAFSDPKCQPLLLSKFLALLNQEKLAEWHLPPLEVLCQQADEICDSSCPESAVNELINLLLANAVDFSKDRKFGSIILLLINLVKKHRAVLNFPAVTSQLGSIVQFYKGPLKFKANQLLKKLTT